MHNPDEEFSDPPGFVPVSADEEIIAAIARNDISTAAALLRSMSHLNQPALEMLAELLDGDWKQDSSLPERYPYRLKVTPWGNPGRRPGRSTDKLRLKSRYQPKPLVASQSDARLALSLRDEIKLAKVQGEKAPRKVATKRVADRFGVSESRINLAFTRRYGKKRPPKSST